MGNLYGPCRLHRHAARLKTWGRKDHETGHPTTPGRRGRSATVDAHSEDASSGELVRDRPATGVVRVAPMPVGHAILARLPAEVHFAAVEKGWEIHQTQPVILDLTADLLQFFLQFGKVVGDAGVFFPHFLCTGWVPTTSWALQAECNRQSCS